MNSNCISLGEVPASGEALVLPLTADATGTWSFMASFNGAYQYVQFPFTSGQVFTIPVRLNESYAYSIKLFRPDNSLFNDTAYCLTTYPLTVDTNWIYLTPTGTFSNPLQIGRKQYTATEGQTVITDNILKTARQVTVFAEGTILTEGNEADGYTFSSTAGTVTFHTPLINEQRITIIWFK